MRKLLLINIALLFVISSYAQHKGDYNWMFGYNYTDSIPGLEGTLINFNQNPPSVSYQAVQPDDQALGNSVSVMSHPESGKLLFYSNGCKVFDASHSIMLNGDNINPTELSDYYCNGASFNWYPILGTLLSIEDTYNPNQYYFFHVPMEWSETGRPFCDRLMYSYIDMTKNEGLGEIVLKNEVYYEGEKDVQCASTSIIKHKNGKDWWILHLIDESNQFLIFLVDSTGPHLYNTQEIGKPHIKLGRTTFSPDGEILGIFNDRDGYFQYDFDRATGLLSNPKHIKLHEFNLGGGLAYSPSSEFVYLFYEEKVYQLETDQEDLNDGVVLVDTLILTGDGIISGFSHAQLGPDCKIYITHRSGANYLGVINYPDEKGKACNLEQRGQYLAYYHDILSIPNFPPFRVDEEDKCDDTMTSIFPTEIRQRGSYIVYYPNPVVDMVKVLPKRDSQYSITDANGRMVEEGSFVENVETVVDMSGMQAGVYFLNVLVDGVIVQSEKLLKYEKTSINKHSTSICNLLLCTA